MMDTATFLVVFAQLSALKFLGSAGSAGIFRDLLGIQAISLQTNCHCGPKAASKRKASFPTSLKRSTSEMWRWNKKKWIEPVDNNDLVKNIKIKEYDYIYIHIYICESLYTLYYILYIYYVCIYIYIMYIYIHILYGVVSNSGMDRPAVIQMYGSVWITCVLVWIGGTDRPVGSGYGSGLYILTRSHIIYIYIHDVYIYIYCNM